MKNFLGYFLTIIIVFPMMALSGLTGFGIALFLAVFLSVPFLLILMTLFFSDSKGKIYGALKAERLHRNFDRSFAANHTSLGHLKQT